MVTFLLVIFRDLTEGILVGFALSTLLFLHRMSQSVAVEHTGLAIDEDKADSVNGTGRTPSDVGQATDPDVAVVRVTGAFFFCPAAAVGAALARIAPPPRASCVAPSAFSAPDPAPPPPIPAFTPHPPA